MALQGESIEVQVRVGDVWRWYSYLIRGADRPGHYGSAAEHWQWARTVCSKFPEKYRIVDFADK